MLLGTGEATSGVGKGEEDHEEEEEEEEEGEEEDEEDEEEEEGVEETLPEPEPIVEVVSKSEEELLTELPSCITLEQGWWSYKWCHKKEIRQFHKEPDGTIPQDWSLGKFDASGKKFRTGSAVGKKDASSTRSAFYSHFFIGGQRCDETGGGRSTEVQFYCCDDDKGTYILSISEPATCQYALKICAPALCKASAPAGYSSLYPPCGSCKKRFKRAGMTLGQRKTACKTACPPMVVNKAKKTKQIKTKTTTEQTKTKKKKKKKKKTKKATAGKGLSKAQPVVQTEEELLRVYNSNCMLLEKGWWSYKWCHKKEIRQYHKEADGSVVADWSLGKYHHTSTPSSKRAGSAGKQTSASTAAVYYSHFFNQGQQCEETKALRQTEVRFHCCDDGKGAYIQSIDEPATCQYTLKICAPELCGESSPADYSSLYPPCGKCKKRFKRTDMSLQQREAACKTACKGQATTPASIEARRACEVKAAKDGTRIRFFGALWQSMVLEDSVDLSWADSMGAVTALGVR
jgi:hypothetical protein